MWKTRSHRVSTRVVEWQQKQKQCLVDSSERFSSCCLGTPCILHEHARKCEMVYETKRFSSYFITKNKIFYLKSTATWRWDNARCWKMGFKLQFLWNFHNITFTKYHFCESLYLIFKAYILYLSAGLNSKIKLFYVFFQI